MGHLPAWIIFGVFNPVIEAFYGLTALPFLGCCSNSDLRHGDASARSSNETTPTNPNQAPGPTWPGKLALEIGLPIGVLVLACLILFLVCYRRRRRRRSSVGLINDAPEAQIIPFVIPGRFLAVRRKQAQGVLPPERPADVGAAHTASSYV